MSTIFVQGIDRLPTAPVRKLTPGEAVDGGLLSQQLRLLLLLLLLLRPADPSFNNTITRLEGRNILEGKEICIFCLI